MTIPLPSSPSRPIAMPGRPLPDCRSRIARGGGGRRRLNVPAPRGQLHSQQLRPGRRERRQPPPHRRFQLARIRASEIHRASATRVPVIMYSSPLPSARSPSRLGRLKPIDCQQQLCNDRERTAPVRAPHLGLLKPRRESLNEQRGAPHGFQHRVTRAHQFGRVPSLDRLRQMSVHQSAFLAIPFLPFALSPARPAPGMQPTLRRTVASELPVRLPRCAQAADASTRHLTVGNPLPAHLSGTSACSLATFRSAGWGVRGCFGDWCKGECAGGRHWASEFDALRGKNAGVYREAIHMVQNENVLRERVVSASH